MPDVWGPGQLLAFSGLDGPTSWSEPFVLHTGERVGDLTVLLPVKAHIAFAGLDRLRGSMILGDAIAGSANGDAFMVVFLDHHTLAGQLPDGATLRVGDGPLPETAALVNEEKGLGLFAAAQGRRWVLHVHAAGDSAGAAAACRRGLQADLAQALAERSALVQSVPVPAGMSAAHTRLLRKGVSVMKVNTHSACGTLKRRWSTPDRWPHRNMWLWDSAFHAVGMAYVDVDSAKDVALAMLEQVRDDGMLPHMVGADGSCSQITQPPILGWAVAHILARSEDLQWAAECKPRLLRYLEWMRLNRDRNGNGIPEWYIEGQPLCRCGESGLDNSPVYDRGVLLDAVDFGSFLCHDYRCLAEIATRLGDTTTAGLCLGHAAHISDAINRWLWCDQARFYFHRDFDGNRVKVKAVSGFMPLFAGVASSRQADDLARHLQDPATFNAPLPVPSVSLDSGTYCKDMWRGPTWMNLNYLIHLGLRRYGLAADACRLREQTLGAIQKWYERDGCLWEYYDSLDVTPPRDLDRKQRLITGKGIAPISDYHWTAAVTTALLLGD